MVVLRTYSGGLLPTNELSLKFHSANLNLKSIQVQRTLRLVFDNWIGVKDAVPPLAEVTVILDGESACWKSTFGKIIDTLYAVVSP